MLHFFEYYFDYEKSIRLKHTTTDLFTRKVVRQMAYKEEFRIAKIV
jgi:hypothetical protein